MNIGQFVQCSPEFDLESRLQEAVARHELELLADDLLSPSPPSTPPSTPQVMPVHLLDKFLANELSPHSPTIPQSSPAVNPIIQVPASEPEGKRGSPDHRRKEMCKGHESEDSDVLQSELSPTERRKRKKAQHRRENKKKKRFSQQPLEARGPPERKETREKYVDRAIPVYTPTFTASANVASTGYTARNNDCKDNALLKDLLGPDYMFKLQRWDGRMPLAIIDVQGRIIGILAGQPDDSPGQPKKSTWTHVREAGSQALEDAWVSLNSKSKKQNQHRRGAFTTLGCGVSHGGGQTHPMNLSNSKKASNILKDLNSRKCFKRIASYGSSVFQSWAPELYGYYSATLGKLFEEDSSLKRPFNSIFTAATYNLGPQTVCFPHVDFANLPFGFCAITALGDFNPKEGGHLVLWECKLVIEFPPGSTILIPSSIITHSNTPVGDHEKRFSFTQYSAGALFRWVDCGFQTLAKYKQGLNKDELEGLKESDANRWKSGLELLPRVPFVSLYK